MNKIVKCACGNKITRQAKAGVRFSCFDCKKKRAKEYWRERQERRKVDGYVVLKNAR